MPCIRGTAFPSVGSHPTCTFNIKEDSITIGNFSQTDIATLTAQYTDEADVLGHTPPHPLQQGHQLDAAQQVSGQTHLNVCFKLLF